MLYLIFGLLGGAVGDVLVLLLLVGSLKKTKTMQNKNTKDKLKKPRKKPRKNKMNTQFFYIKTEDNSMGGIFGSIRFTTCCVELGG